MRPIAQVKEVLSLVAAGLNDCEIARRTGIPRRTVQDWRHGRNRLQNPRQGIDYLDLPCEIDHRGDLPRPPYAYLLGIYLGDGCLSRPGRSKRSWALRVFCDARYPGIVNEIAIAMEALFPEKRANQRLRRDCACVVVTMYSRHWSCLLPQHGPGRKHLRRIELAPWQQEIVDSCRREFLRGLIHSDGCRHIACERKGRNVRHAPRYAFSNRSEDIKALFCDACDGLGIHWTRPSPKTVAVYRLASVALLDEFVGPKY